MATTSSRSFALPFGRVLAPIPFGRVLAPLGIALVAAVGLAGGATPADAAPATPSLVIGVEARDRTAGSLGVNVTCTSPTTTAGGVSASSRVVEALSVEIDADGHGNAIVPAVAGTECLVETETDAGYALTDASGGEPVTGADGNLSGVRVQVGDGPILVQLGVVGPIATGTGSLIVESTSRDGDIARIGLGVVVVLVVLSIGHAILADRRRRTNALEIPAAAVEEWPPNPHHV